MHVVIVGAGEIGIHIASQLILENKDVVIVEKNPGIAQAVSGKLDCMVLAEDGNNPETLVKAGIEKAEYFISVTNSDEINMIASGLVTSEFNVPHKIARVRNLDYYRSKILGESFLDIDLIVNPGIEAARSVIQTIAMGATSGVMTFAKTGIQMRNLFVDPASPFSGKTLIQIRQSFAENFLVSAITRKNNVIIPTGSTVINAGDMLYLAATPENQRKIFARAGRGTEKIKKVVIVGADTIGTLVAEVLIMDGFTVTIVERDAGRCGILAGLIPGALIINADISDEGIFDEERLHAYDLMVTSTGNQELNILTAAYAKSMDIKRTVAIVNKASYYSIASRLGIDSTISPKNCAADAILKYMRGKNIQSVHSILEGRAEVIEFLAGASSAAIGVPLRDLTLPENSLIIAVARGEEEMVPDGDFSIAEGDSVLVITKKKSIPKIERLFSQKQ